MQSAAVAPASDLDSLMYQNRAAKPLAIPPPGSAPPAAYAAPLPAAVAVPPMMDAPAEAPYTLDSGDRLRVVVFGQDGLSNSYAVRSPCR
jgi:polysaccharide export outer membrane protein